MCAETGGTGGCTAHAYRDFCCLHPLSQSSLYSWEHVLLLHFHSDRKLGLETFSISIHPSSIY